MVETIGEILSREVILTITRQSWVTGQKEKKEIILEDGKFRLTHNGEDFMVDQLSKFSSEEQVFDYLYSRGFFKLLSETSALIEMFDFTNRVAKFIEFERVMPRQESKFEVPKLDARIHAFAEEFAPGSNCVLRINNLAVWVPVFHHSNSIQWVSVREDQEAALLFGVTEIEFTEKSIELNSFKSTLFYLAGFPSPFEMRLVARDEFIIDGLREVRFRFVSDPQGKPDTESPISYRSWLDQMFAEYSWERPELLSKLNLDVEFIESKLAAAIRRSTYHSATTEGKIWFWKPSSSMVLGPDDDSFEEIPSSVFATTENGEFSVRMGAITNHDVMATYLEIPRRDIAEINKIAQGAVISELIFENELPDEATEGEFQLILPVGDYTAHGYDSWRYEIPESDEFEKHVEIHTYKNFHEVLNKHSEWNLLHITLVAEPENEATLYQWRKSITISSGSVIESIQVAGHEIIKDDKRFVFDFMETQERCAICKWPN